MDKRKACIVCGDPLFGKQMKYCKTECAKRAGREAWVMKVYAITLEEYEQILDHQGGGCAICGKVLSNGQHYHIDHEHGGIVRGLLCAYCNTRLVGRLKDHSKAQRLADYLRDPPARYVIGSRVAPGRPPKKRQPRKRAR